MNTLLKGVLLGAGTTLAVVSLTSFQSTVSQMLRVVVTNPVELQAVDTNPVSAFPDPRDAVQILEGAPYTVPEGKLLLLSGLGVRDGSGNFDAPFLEIDNQRIVEVNLDYDSNTAFAIATIQPLPDGLVATAGQVVEASNNDGTGVALGFLVAEQP